MFHARMNDMPNAVIDLLSGRASVDEVAGRFESAERDLLAGISGTLAPADASTSRERRLEEENRLLRDALLREATLRAELLRERRIPVAPAPRRRRRRARARRRH